MVKFLAITLGILAGLIGTQAPNFTANYVQNITGRIAELQSLVEEFDASVSNIGYTRKRALTECKSAQDLLKALCDPFASSVERYELLSAHLAQLNAASDLERPIVLAKTYFKEVAQSTYDNYEPAVPTTSTGAIYGGGGFLGVWGAVQLFFSIIGGMFGMGRR